MDYSQIKRLASIHNLSVNDLTALATINDPFYVGQKNQLEKGEWFAKVYDLMGRPTNCHIRRVHYWLVTTNAIPKPNGQPYENTDNDWSLLTNAAKYARYLGLVPIENIVDRRNPPAIVNIQYWNNRSASSIRDSIDENEIIDDIVRRFYPFNPFNTQAYALEIWAEKSTMNDVLEPVCEKYGMNLVTGLGEISITAVYLLAHRIVDAKKPVRIFYVSDFDPAGECMPVSAARKIEYFMRTYDILQDVKLIPLVLTAEQCTHYNLPRTPIKNPKNDHPGYISRKKRFQSRHGVGATELDALEAIHPGELQRIIESAIESYFDVEAWNEAIRKNKELQSKVRKYLVGGECWMCGGKGEYDTYDEDGYDVGTEECSVCSGTGQIPGRIGTEVMSELEVREFDTYSPPIADEIDDSDIQCLYDSNTDYISQIDKYREHQNQISDRNSKEKVDIDAFREEIE